MRARLIRILAMALKEMRVVLLDKRAKTTLAISPIVQLVLFGLATTLEVKNVDIGVVNRDAGIASERLLASLAGSRQVREIAYYPNTDKLIEAIDHREVIAGLVIPTDLSRNVAAGRIGEVGVLLDGRRSNAAQIVNGYLSDIARSAGASLRPASRLPAPSIEPVHWFNPNLDYRWFTLPAMITVITIALMFSVSAQAMARERELGTYDQLMTLPLRPSEILIGKMAPAFFVGVFNAALYAALIPLFFGVPFNGSIGMLFLAIVCFSLAITGAGLCVSAVARNQQQAFLGGFLVVVPMILLSGYASPVDNMPDWLKPAAAINPLTHMLVICEGIFLKDLPAAAVIERIWPILGFAAASLPLAGWLFKQRGE